MKSIRDVLLEAGLPEDRIAAVIEALPAPDSDRWNPAPAYLRELLEAAGLSQRRAADILGINERQMRHFFAGKLQAPYTVQFCLQVLAFLNTAEKTPKPQSEDSDD